MFNESDRDGIECREEAFQSDMDRVYLKKMRIPKKNHGGKGDAVCQKTISGSADSKKG